MPGLPRPEVKLIIAPTSSCYSTRSQKVLGQWLSLRPPRDSRLTRISFTTPQKRNFTRGSSGGGPASGAPQSPPQLCPLTSRDLGGQAHLSVPRFPQRQNGVKARVTRAAWDSVRSTASSVSEAVRRLLALLLMFSTGQHFLSSCLHGRGLIAALTHNHSPLRLGHHLMARWRPSLEGITAHVSTQPLRTGHTQTPQVFSN